jgi:integrase
MAPRIPFTKTAIEALPAPASGRVTYRLDDDRIPGLELRVTSSGAKTFSVFRRVKGGKPERITLGRFPMMTVEEAKKRAARINLEIEAGANPAALKRTNREEITFAALFADYLDRHAKLHKRTWREDEAKYARYLAKPIGPKKLSTIRRADVADVHSTISRAGHGTTANRVLALVSSVYGWARSAGLWEDNPALGIRKNAERARDRFLLADEIPRFFASLAMEPNETIRDYFLVSLLTGARRANVLAMRWAEIDFDRAEWRIPRTKNDDPQTVPLAPKVVEILERRVLLRSGPFVFQGRGSRLRPGEPTHLVEPKMGWRRIFDRDELTQLATRIRESGRAFEVSAERSMSESLATARQVAKELKLDTAGARMADARIHDLRRTLGSWQARTGASLAIIGKSLNHKSVQTTAIYSRLETDPVRASVERAASAILAAAGQAPAAEVAAIKTKRRK